MTEAEWLSCTHWMPMLIYLRGEVEPENKPILKGALARGDGTRVTRRQLAMFAYACCRKWWELPLNETGRNLIFSYERFLEGDGSWNDFLSSCARVSENGVVSQGPPTSIEAPQWILTPFGIMWLTKDLKWATAAYLQRDRIEELERTTSDEERSEWVCVGPPPLPEVAATLTAVEQTFPVLLREIVGNPFRPLNISPSWLTWNDAVVVRLAQGAYDKRILPSGTLDKTCLAILADALEEAGCTDESILGHLRSNRDHYRGCFVIDALLGKS